MTTWHNMTDFENARKVSEIFLGINNTIGQGFLGLGILLAVGVIMFASLGRYTPAERMTSTFFVLMIAGFIMSIIGILHILAVYIVTIIFIVSVLVLITSN